MRQQSVRYSISSIVAVVLVIALLSMINWLSTRRWARWDWTSTKIYSLSDKSLNIVERLDNEVEVLVFMTPASPMFSQVHELLARYETASSKISVEFIDVERELLKAQQLAEQYGVQVADTVVFSVADRTKYVTSDQLVEMDYSGAQYGQPPTMKSFTGEEVFTSAILSLVAYDVPTVYFVTGHGEATIEPTPSETSGRNLTVVAEILRRDNMDVAETSLMSGEVPEDADVLAIVGPRRAYTDPEVEAIDGFLEGGGRLLIAIDPLLQPDGTFRKTNLEGLLENHGIEFRDDIVVDPSRQLPLFDWSAVYLDDFVLHPVTQGLENLAVLFKISRSIGGLDQSAKGIVYTSDLGWGETDLVRIARGDSPENDQGDVEGPLAICTVVDRPVAVASDTESSILKENYRIVAFGDADFMIDLDIVSAGNAVLAVNAFNWLAARDQQVGVPPRDVEKMALHLSKREMRRLLVISLVFMPGLAIVAGIMVWRRRRH